MVAMTALRLSSNETSGGMSDLAMSCNNFNSACPLSIVGGFDDVEALLCNPSVVRFGIPSGSPPHWVRPRIRCRLFNLATYLGAALAAERRKICARCHCTEFNGASGLTNLVNHRLKAAFDVGTGGPLMASFHGSNNVR